MQQVLGKVRGLPVPSVPFVRLSLVIWSSPHLLRLLYISTRAAAHSSF